MAQDDGSAESLLRELLVASAAQAAEIKGLSQRVDGVQSDAREARDAARDSLAQTRTQDLPSRIAELKGHVEALDLGRRADLQTAINSVTRETRQKFEAHAKRLDELEAFRDRLEGAGGLVGWVARHAPWLLAIAMTAAAMFGLKDRLP